MEVIYNIENKTEYITYSIEVDTDILTSITFSEPQIF